MFTFSTDALTNVILLTKNYSATYKIYARDRMYAKWMEYFKTVFKFIVFFFLFFFCFFLFFKNDFLFCFVFSDLLINLPSTCKNQSVDCFSLFSVSGRPLERRMPIICMKKKKCSCPFNFILYVSVINFLKNYCIF